MPGERGPKGEDGRTGRTGDPVRPFQNRIQWLKAVQGHFKGRSKF